MNEREELIVKLFTELNYNFNYAILHHIDDVFDQNSDIDFIVDTNYKSFFLFLKQFCDSNNLIISSFYLISIRIYRFDLLLNRNNKLIKIELDCACNSKGLDELGINVKKLLKGKKKCKVKNSFLFKISDESEFYLYIKKKAYKEAVLNQNLNILDYYGYLNEINPISTKEQIQGIYNLFNSYYKSRIVRIKLILLKFLRLIIRMVKPNSSGFTICFLGPDGSGKSTIIEKLVKKQLPFRSHNYFHLKPFPSKIGKPSVPVENPHKFPPYSVTKSYVKLVYFIFQYNFGWLKNIFLLKRKSSLIIFDRYYDDLLVDSKRYRFGGNIKIAERARSFIPKPELYIILSAEAETIYKRKQEVPFKELNNQITRYRKLGDKSNYFNVEVNRSPDEIVNEVVSLIMKKLNGRY